MAQAGLGSAGRGATEDEPSLGTLLRTWPTARWITGALVVGRVLAVVGRPAKTWPDSAEYLTIDFTGEGRRSWPVPLAFRVLWGTDTRLLLGQALLGAVCWGLLALAMAAMVRTPWVRTGVALVVAGIGLGLSVTNWDATLLSESITLSLTVLVLALALNYARRPGQGAAVALLAALFVWVFCRQTQVAPAAALVLVLVVAWFHARRSDVSAGVSRSIGPLTLGALGVTVLATAFFGRNQEIRTTNLSNVAAYRLAVRDDTRAWFERHGLPTGPDGRTLTPIELAADPALRSWIERDGTRTYAEYLALHPAYLALAPLANFSDVRTPRADAPADPSLPNTRVAMLAPPDRYGSSRQVLPSVVEQVLMDPGSPQRPFAGAPYYNVQYTRPEAGHVLALLLGALALGCLRFRARSRRWLLPGTVIVVALGWTVALWHSSAFELNRLSLMSAVTLRLGVVLLLAVMIDDAVQERQRARSRDAG